MKVTRSHYTGIGFLQCEIGEVNVHFDIHLLSHLIKKSVFGDSVNARIGSLV